MRIKEEHLNGRCQTMYGGSNMIIEINLDLEISVLYPKQIPEPQIPRACVLTLVVLVNKMSSTKPNWSWWLSVCQFVFCVCSEMRWMSKYFHQNKWESSSDNLIYSILLLHQQQKTSIEVFPFGNFRMMKKRHKP